MKKVALSSYIFFSILGTFIRDSVTILNKKVLKSMYTVH